MMRTVTFAFLAAVAVAALTQLPLAAADPSMSTPMAGGVVVESAQMSAKVVGVDIAKRTVSLEMPSGKIRTLTVPESVKNLSRLKKGDRINARVVEGLAVYVEKGGPRPSAAETTTVTMRPKGMGAIMAKTWRITGKIHHVDLQNRMVGVTGPGGVSKTFKVGPNVKNLSRLKTGDDIVLRYTEALAVSLQKPTK